MARPLAAAVPTQRPPWGWALAGAAAKTPVTPKATMAANFVFEAMVFISFHSARPAASMGRCAILSRLKVKVRLCR